MVREKLKLIPTCAVVLYSFVVGLSSNSCESNNSKELEEPRSIEKAIPQIHSTIISKEVEVNTSLDSTQLTERTNVAPWIHRTWICANQQDNPIMKLMFYDDGKATLERYSKGYDTLNWTYSEVTDELVFLVPDFEDQLKEMRVVFSIEDPNLFVWEGDFFYPESLIVARKKRAEENPHGQLIGG